MKKKAFVVMLVICLTLVCTVAVYAYQVDRVSGSVGGYSCYGSLWTISSTSMGATTYVNSGASVASNTTSIRVRTGGSYDPVSVTNGPYASNEVDAIATAQATILSAHGTHSLTLVTGDSWAGDTYY